MVVLTAINTTMVRFVTSTENLEVNMRTNRYGVNTALAVNTKTLPHFRSMGQVSKSSIDKAIFTGIFPSVMEESEKCEKC